MSLDVDGEKRQGALYRRFAADELQAPVKVTNTGDGRRAGGGDGVAARR